VSWTHAAERHWP